MIRRHVQSGLIVLGGCVLTGLLTRAVVLDAVQADYGQAGELYRHRGSFEEFLKVRTPADGERLEGETLPPSLRSAGIVAVYRRGRLVHFVMPQTTVGNDNATPEFVYDLDQRGGVVDDILHSTERYTYHVQPLTSSPRWHYWVHN